VFVAPVKQGRLVEATRVGGVRYRSARPLAEGKDVVALSDESGEVELWRLAANGVGEAKQITRNGLVLRFDGLPSPDGAWVATTDKDLKLSIVKVSDGSTITVAASPRWGFGGLAWSPDSAWLAYAIPTANTLSQIRLYRVADGAQVPVTSDRTSSDYPVFSPDGAWLYFLSDRNLVSAVRSPWGDFQPEPFFDRPTRVFAVALSRTARFPFAPATELMPAEDKPVKDKLISAQTPAAATVVDVDGLAGRLWEVPIDPGNYGSLALTANRLLMISRGVGSDRDGALVAVDISREKPKPVTLLEGVREFEVSRDGAKVLARQGDTLLVFDVGVKKVEAGEARVDLGGWKLKLQPREEWRQMFREAWRLERDYFYDRGMHRVDWPGVRAKYGPLVDRVTDRSELSDLLGQMVSELSALHIFVYGGDNREGRDDIAPAALGATLERDDKGGGLRVTHVFRGDPEYPEEQSPLARPDVNVLEGDVIERLDGVSTLTVAAVGELLRAKAGKQVLLRVRPVGSGPARDVVVEPILPKRAAELRYAEWERTRRERVDALSGGAIGYVHLRAMNGANYTEWARQFYPVFKRAGLIIDVRHNRGGNIDSWILEKLLRRAWFFWQPRTGDTYWNMQEAFRGHLAVLVDERTASDGEAFALGFRRLGLGKVIGSRTWGGEIWLSSSNFLVDKGIATAAETGVFGPEGQWLIEGWGVEPDVVVDNLPGETFRGRDAQLDAAVSHLQQLIAAQPVLPPSPPLYPDRSTP
jgi:tricorn protease